MMRAKAAFLCARRFEKSAADLEAGADRLELLAENQITEDYELGSRLHTVGCKFTFVNEKLATGEVRARPLSGHPICACG